MAITSNDSFVKLGQLKTYDARIKEYIRNAENSIVELKNIVDDNSSAISVLNGDRDTLGSVENKIQKIVGKYSDGTDEKVTIIDYVNTKTKLEFAQNSDIDSMF